MNQPDEVLSMLLATRRGPGLVTNCFLEEQTIRALAADGRLEAFSLAGVACLLHREDMFHRLYFSAPGLNLLRQAMSGLPLPSGEFITDIVGPAGRFEVVAAALEQAGFSPYEDFQRMARAPGELPPARNAVIPSRAEFASPEDATQVYELIATSFDPRAEHLPSLSETAEAVARGCVLVARYESQIAAVLFFTRGGMTTILRFWLVVGRFRGMGLGDLLVRSYFAECSACRRFTLWVRRGNDNAIRRYLDYGYRQDGTIDRIMRKVS